MDLSVRSDGRYYALDLMRGVAALCVAAFHYGLFDRQFVPYGFLAVDFFFALSGFVIASAYERRIVAGFSIANFVRLRIVRLFPLHFIGVTLGTIGAVYLLATGNLHALSPSALMAAAVLNGLMLPNSLDGSGLFTLNGPAWSLFLEMAVNFAFATFLAKRSTLLLLCVAGVAAIVTALFVFSYGSSDIGWNAETLPGGVARALFGFVAGMLIARGRYAKSKRQSWLVMCPILLLITALVSLPQPSLVFELGFCLIFAPCLVALCAAIDIPARGRRVAALLGDISYPLYCIHMPLVPVVRAIVRHAHLPPVLGMLAFLGILSGASLMLAAYFDAPIRQRLSRCSVTNRPRFPASEG